MEYTFIWIHPLKTSRLIHKAKTAENHTKNPFLARSNLPTLSQRECLISYLGKYIFSQSFSIQSSSPMFFVKGIDLSSIMYVFYFSELWFLAVCALEQERTKQRQLFTDNAHDPCKKMFYRTLLSTILKCVNSLKIFNDDIFLSFLFTVLLLQNLYPWKYGHLSISLCCVYLW